MKKMLLHLLPCLLCICFFNACKKGFNDQQSMPPPQQQPDLITQALVNVSGFVTDENGNAVFNALVTAGSKSTNTDSYGYFNITDASVSKTAPFIKISKTGYFESYRTFVAKENEASFTRVKLVPKTNAGSIDAASGGTVTIAGGSVSIPANAVVNAGTDAPYTGKVHVAVHLFDQSNAAEFGTTAPGDNRGINSDGLLQLLQSYFMMAVELTGDAGELLQIARGKEATISGPPIPVSQTTSVPASIALWSFDITKGLWKQEGTATKNGNNYVGKVSHFSFWDGAVGIPLVNLTVQIVNTALQPMGNVFVLVRSAVDPASGTAAYTNNDGFAIGAIPANASLILEVYSTCNGAVQVLSQNFTTANADIDLGTLTANLGDQVTVTGTVVNCSNTPVADGEVIMYARNTSNSTTVYKTPVTNGNFTFSTAACSDMELTYVAIDNNANQQGISQTTTLVAGMNNLGQLTACGTSTMGFINYAVDGGPMITLAEPADTLIGSYNFFTPTNTGGGNILKIGITQNTMPDLAFSYFGLNILGSDHTVTDLWSISFAGPSHRARIPVPLPLTFTEFGEVGGFMAGSFSGNVENWDDGSAHTISCTFRVRRWN